MVVKSHSALRVSLPVLILLNERLARTDARFNAQTKCAASNSVYDIIEAAVSTTRNYVLLQHTNSSRCSFVNFPYQSAPKKRAVKISDWPLI